MANERADIFAEEDDDLGLSQFKPKPIDQPQRPGPETLTSIAGQGKFVSREPATDLAKPRTKWRYRTGRDQQFNTRASQATINGYTALAERLNCPIAEVVERALHALQKELDASQVRQG
jgi:hypothetical protein